MPGGQFWFRYCWDKVGALWSAAIPRSGSDDLQGRFCLGEDVAGSMYSAKGAELEIFAELDKRRLAESSQQFLYVWGVSATRVARGEFFET